MSKKTSASRAYETIKTLPVGSSFSVKDIMAKMPDFVTESAVGNLVWKMTKQGYLSKIKGSWQYGVIAKTKDFEKVHKFTSTYNKQPGKRPKAKQRSTGVLCQGNTDYDIIENLLNAMALAEPILRRYKKLDKFIYELNSELS